MDLINNTHSPFRELIPAYALEALESEEIELLDRHLETCQECIASLVEYKQLVEGLLHAVPPRKPPAYLRTNLSEKVTDSKQLLTRPTRNIWKFGSLAAGILSILLLITTILLAAQERELRKQWSGVLQKLEEDQIALEIAAQPDARLLTLSGDQAHGNLVMIPGSNRGALILFGLPPLNPDQTFQVWLIPAEGQPQSAGLFQLDPGQNMHLFEVASLQPLEDFAGLGITIEPSGGSLLPSSNPILSLSF